MSKYFAAHKLIGDNGEVYAKGDEVVGLSESEAATLLARHSITKAPSQSVAKTVAAQENAEARAKEAEAREAEAETRAKAAEDELVKKIEQVETLKKQLTEAETRAKATGEDLVKMTEQVETLKKQLAEAKAKK